MTPHDPPTRTILTYRPKTNRGTESESRAGALKLLDTCSEPPGATVALMYAWGSSIRGTAGIDLLRFRRGAGGVWHHI